MDYPKHVWVKGINPETKENKDGRAVVVVKNALEEKALTEGRVELGHIRSANPDEEQHWVASITAKSKGGR